MFTQVIYEFKPDFNSHRSVQHFVLQKFIVLGVTGSPIRASDLVTGQCFNNKIFNRKDPLRTQCLPELAGKIESDLSQLSEVTKKSSFV